MNLSSGFLRGLVATRWKLTCGSATIAYTIDGSSTTALSYLDLVSVTKHNSMVSYKLIIKSKLQQQEFSGISSEDCELFIEYVKKYAGGVIASRIDLQRGTMLSAIEQFENIKVGDFYLNQSKVAEVRDSLPQVVSQLIEHPFFDARRIDPHLQAFAQDFKYFGDSDSNYTIKRNAKYVARKKAEYASVFDTVEKYPLTDEQRTAVVTEEDNLLLVAAAGSGKSSTLIAKILYLLKEGQYNAEQIISFAYNKDAQLELTARIDALFERFNWNTSRVPARTFHGFCMEVLAAVNGEKPSISAVANSSKNQQLTYFNELVDDQCASNPSFATDLLTFYSIFKLPAPRDGEIESLSDYNHYLMSLRGRSGRDPITGEWRVELTAMNGLEVKSLEEIRIANWLFLKGIKFEYERPYEQHTADQEHRQYYPDFYYPDADLWHEHFAIDSQGRAPKFMQKYEDGVSWKRALHKEKGTRLIETHSAHFQDGSVFDRLDQALRESNIPRHPPSNDQLEALIKKAFNPSRDLELVITFLKHFKTNNLDLHSLHKRAAQYSDPMRAKALLRVFEPVYEAYQARLEQAGEIDYEDLVHKACGHIETGAYQSHYEYILVDEFQDTSQDRLRLIKALAAQHKHSKLFGVGDDWQSIYRFSGADLKVMTGFPEIFGFTKQLQLSQTFRSVKQIVDVASEFVQRNPDQFKKTVETLTAANQDPVILTPYDPGHPDKCLESRLNAIQKRAQHEAVQVSAFILTRYVIQKPSNLNYLSTQYPNILVEWKTIHASKGLEADYVIIHHMNAGSYGFPSEMSDDPLLDLVIPENEVYPHAEERRLLYVALTRAKRAVFGFYNPNTPSAFVRELSDIDGVKVQDKRFDRVVESGQTCPKCKQGEVWARTGSQGPFLGCDHYPSCKFTTNIRCPECKLGVIVERTSKNTGNEFYACDQFPKCKHFYRMPWAKKSKASYVASPKRSD